MLAEALTEFDPVLYSMEGNGFLIDHLGETRQMATLRGVPPGVGRDVLDILDEVYRYDQQMQATGQTWVGFEAVKNRCRTYLEQLQKWEAAYQQNIRRDPGYPRYPSMCTWDSFGRYHKGAVGSDSGRVRSYFDETGARQPFAIELQAPAADGYVPEWQRGIPKAIIYRQLIEDEDKGFIECPICSTRESYEVQSRTSRNQARMRMAKHLTKAKVEKDAHKQLHSYEYGSH